jgi:hypothetical protein
LREMPEIEDCWFVAGEETFVIKVRVADMPSLEQVIGALNRIRGVARTRTTVVLSTRFEGRPVRCRSRREASGRNLARCVSVRRGRPLSTSDRLAVRGSGEPRREGALAGRGSGDGGLTAAFGVTATAEPPRARTRPDRCTGVACPASSRPRGVSQVSDRHLSEISAEKSGSHPPP